MILGCTYIFFPHNSLPTLSAPLTLINELYLHKYDSQGFLFRQPHNLEGLWYWWTSLLYFLRCGWAHQSLRNVFEKLIPMWSKAAQTLSLPGNLSTCSIFPPICKTLWVLLRETSSSRIAFGTHSPTSKSSHALVHDTVRTLECCAQFRLYGLWKNPSDKWLMLSCRGEFLRSFPGRCDRTWTQSP